MGVRQHLLAQVVVVTQLTPAPAYNAVAVSRGRTGSQRHGQLARPPSRPVHVSVPAYNMEDNSLVCDGLQHYGRFTRPTHLSAPEADSPVSDFSVT